MRTDLRGWLQQAAQNDDDWLPVHFEFAFGLDPREGRDPASTATEAVLKEGVRLRGSIDLVERHHLNRALRVTDHKTGKAPDQVPAYVGGGRHLQPILYALAAEKLLGEKVEAGRLFYATQRGGYQHMLIPAGDAARRFLAPPASEHRRSHRGRLPSACAGKGRLLHLRLPAGLRSL